MTNQPAIATKRLSKTFGEIEAVRGVSFHVNTGEIFSPLGRMGPSLFLDGSNIGKC
jgi:ABC-type multidrug transport system ATPase subunit